MTTSIDTHDRLVRDNMLRAGMAVVGIAYSLSPEHKFPVALNEIDATLVWLEQQAAALDLDAGRIFIGGDSAGANFVGRGLPRLAGMLLSTMARSMPRRCRATSYTQYGDPEYPLSPDEMDGFWANYVSELAAQLATRRSAGRAVAR